MLNSHQNKILSSVMEYNAFPDKMMRERLAEELDLPEKVIQVWFQNKRQQCRKKINSPQFLFTTHTSPPLAPRTILSPSPPHQHQHVPPPPKTPKLAISSTLSSSNAKSDINILAMAAEMSMAVKTPRYTTYNWEKSCYPWGGEGQAENNTPSEPKSLS